MILIHPAPYYQQMQTPLLVATSMTKHVNGPSWLMASPEKFSKASVRWIGYEPMCNPYWWHSVQWFILHVASPPDVLLNAISYWIFLRIKTMHEQEDALWGIQSCNHIGSTKVGFSIKEYKCIMYLPSLFFGYTLDMKHEELTYCIQFNLRWLGLYCITI